jgi:hypothetical protein
LGGLITEAENLAYASVLWWVGLAEVELVVGAGVDVERNESALLVRSVRTADIDDVAVARNIEHARHHLFDGGLVAEPCERRQMIVDGGRVERVVLDGHAIPSKLQTRAALSHTICRRSASGTPLNCLSIAAENSAKSWADADSHSPT